MLVCTRADGSTTWMQTTAFFTIHDLAHYVVEKNLNFRHGFYGMVAGGVNITDFEDKQKFRPRELPLEALYAENLVVLLLTELSDSRLIEDFQKSFNDVCLQFGSPLLMIDAALLATMRNEIRELIDHWKSLAENKTLQLNF
ncbi:MAG TPA: hypothetical protein VEB86_10640 [Chryseosolibacter sp.]|nr:hypothetical protein [Chryseosolibacter sp.]